MNSISVAQSGLPQRLHPLSLFVQLTSRQASGCLRVLSSSTVWSLFLRQGRLTFASSSVNPFERLDRHLSQLSQQIPALVEGVRSHVRLLFEPAVESQSYITADYQAIEWLVAQRYLNPAQVTRLTENLAQEVIESLLKVTEGSHEFIDREMMLEFPDLCELELRPIVERCQTKLRRQVINQSTQPLPPAISEPIADPISEPARPQENAMAASNQPSLKTRYTIASVDDSPTVLQAMNSFLNDENLSIVTINDPLKALIQIVRCKPDLVLLDVSMPNLDGYELCSLLRRHSSFKTTPIVMVTGNTGFIDRARAKLVGASGYMTKPFTRSELLKMVFKYLK